MTIKDSGARTLFDTGAVRDLQTGKGRMDLLPMDALIELSKHMEKGCAKYGERNWEKGIPVSRFVDSAMRHMAHVMLGDIDECHLTAACWNMMCCLATILRIEEGILPVELFDIEQPFPKTWTNSND